MRFLSRWLRKPRPGRCASRLAAISGKDIGVVRGKLHTSGPSERSLMLRLSLVIHIADQVRKIRLFTAS